MTQLLSALALFGIVTFAQTSVQTGPTTATPAFEVVSIKPDTSDGRGISLNIQQSGGFAAMAFL